MTNEEWSKSTGLEEDLDDLEILGWSGENDDWGEIFGDIELADIEKSDEKEEINSSKDFINQERDSYIQFDKEFRCFLKNFVHQQNEKEKQKLIFKKIFFCCILLGFFILIITPLILIFQAKAFSQTSMVVAMISVVIELVSAIIVLPKIIAEYLFNKEEDENMMEIIKSMQSYNEKKHDHFEV